MDYRDEHLCQRKIRWILACPGNQSKEFFGGLYKTARAGQCTPPHQGCLPLHSISRWIVQFIVSNADVLKAYAA
jgi:hypothetical protein